MPKLIFQDKHKTCHTIHHRHHLVQRLFQQVHYLQQHHQQQQIITSMIHQQCHRLRCHHHQQLMIHFFRRHSTMVVRSINRIIITWKNRPFHHSIHRSIRIHSQVILRQLVYHIHSIRMQLHLIFQVKHEPIRIIFVNHHRIVHRQRKIRWQQIQYQHHRQIQIHHRRIHGINQHIAPIQDLQVR